MGLFDFSEMQNEGEKTQGISKQDKLPCFAPLSMRSVIHWHSLTSDFFPVPTFVLYSIN